MYMYIYIYIYIYIGPERVGNAVARGTAFNFGADKRAGGHGKGEGASVFVLSYN